MSERVTLIEVGPRDGLQNEATTVSPETRAAFIAKLAHAGLKEIEAGSFVSPKAVPQMADTDRVFALLQRKPGVLYSALVPNLEGWRRAQASGVSKIAVFTGASETFNRKNIGCTLAESIERFKPVVEAAHSAGLPVRGYVSCAFFCPYEGKILPSATLGAVRLLRELGDLEISLGDTVGRAAPRDVRSVLDLVCKEVPLAQINLHLHDTYHLAVASALMAYKEYGVTRFDASAGGLGGCPFAKGATGNVATEDLAFAFHAEGVECGLDLDLLLEAARFLFQEMGRAAESRLSQVPNRID